jgi:hypothetical protein
MSQDKHVIILHSKEDRDVFINKVKFPKTVYHVGDNPQPGDIITDKKCGYQRLFANWVLDHYDNLPEFVILTQAIPDDHVVEPLIAIECTFTDNWGSFAYARSMYNQWSTNWVKLSPIREVAHFLGVGFHNDNNVSKNLYYFHPGEIFYVSRKKLLEKSKEFYQKLIMLDDKEFYFKFLKSEPKPPYFWNDITRFHPELNGLSQEAKLNKLENLEWNVERDFGYSGCTLETLWFYIWADEDVFDTIDTAQACIGNELYFNTNSKTYNDSFSFMRFPFSPDSHRTMMNFRLLENNWFDWNCPNYLRWREALVKKTIWEGEQRGFDGTRLLKFYEDYGYKHISF